MSDMMTQSASPVWSRQCGAALLVLAIVGCGCATALAELSVNSSFPGGSGKVVRIDQENQKVVLEPSRRPNRGWECWWYVRIDGATAGATLLVDVGDAPWATPERASISVDNKAWRFTKPGSRARSRIAYSIEAPAEQFWLAWGPPFTPADAQRLVDRSSKHADATAFELCKTREMRKVPALHVRKGDEAKRHVVWVQARQHAWEAGSSWVCQGLTDWLISDEERAGLLRDRAEVFIVPIMDIDNSAVGAGGKNQIPRDHNRDWDDKPYWPAVAAAQEKLRELNTEQRLDIFIDLHNPGATARHPYFYIVPRHLLNRRGQRNLNSFLACSREEMSGPLSFVGQTVESGSGYDRNWKRISKNWVSLNSAPHVVSVTLETAWNTPHSDAAGYQQVGRQLGLAVERFLRTDPK